MTEQAKYDAIVIGGRLAGLSAAFEFVDKGRRGLICALEWLMPDCRLRIHRVSAEC